MSNVISGIAVLLEISGGVWVVIGPLMIVVGLFKGNWEMVGSAIVWLMGIIIACTYIDKTGGTDSHHSGLNEAIDRMNESEIRHYYARHYQPPRDDKKDTYQGDPWLSGGM